MLGHFLSAGFRPMFLLGAVWSALCVLLWIAFLTGLVPFAHPWSALDWHVHEMVFGYGSAALAGFLLTAIPNWTGRPPVKGGALAALVLLWLAGRAALYFVPPLSLLAAALIDISFALMLLALTTREILAAGNRRNLPVMVIVLIFALANLAFHWQAGQGDLASQSTGARFGIAALVLLISLIGGRIVPVFSRNWLQARGRTDLPPAFNRFDGAVMLLTVPALLLWAITPDSRHGAALLALVGGLHLLRLARWRAATIWREPLLIALHLGYAFVPLGMGLMAASQWLADVPFTAGLHAWTAGAIGTMTLTVMTRAVLGHSGRAIRAHPIETTYLALVILAALLRVLSGLTYSTGMLHASSALWMAAFLLFALHVLPMVFGPRADA